VAAAMVATSVRHYSSRAGDMNLLHTVSARIILAPPCLTTCLE